MLTAQGRKALLAAGVFRGGFTLQALGAVLGRSPEAELGELLDASLVRREHGVARFALLELVRAFARAELRDEEQERELRRAHRLHFAAVADVIGVELADGDPRSELAEQLRPDSANLRAALDDAFAAGDGASALALVRGMRALWYTGWLVHEGQARICRVLDSFELDPDDELLLLRSVSFLEGVGTAPETGGALTERLVRRAEELGDLPSVCVGVSNLVAMAHNAQDRERVAELQPRLAELAEADLPPRHLAFVHYALAGCDYLDGDLQGACEHAESGVRLAADGDHAYLLGATSMLRLMMCSMRDGELSRGELESGMATMMLAPIRPLAPFSLWLVARYAAAFDREAGIHWLAQAEHIYRNLGTQMWPECDVRDQAMAALGIDRIPPAQAPDPDYQVTLDAALAWLRSRPEDEVARF
jgi:hypothetical protein